VALVIYLGINVGAAALHQHHTANAPRSHEPSTKDTQSNFSPASLADDDGDSEENCTLCTVLHQARILAASADALALSAPTGDILPFLSLCLPCLPTSATHARAPPAA
jgi:hypothetical protein